MDGYENAVCHVSIGWGYLLWEYICLLCFIVVYVIFIFNLGLYVMGDAVLIVAGIVSCRCTWVAFVIFGEVVFSASLAVVSGAYVARCRVALPDGMVSRLSLFSQVW